MRFVIMKIKNNERKSKTIIHYIYIAHYESIKWSSYTIINTCSRHRKFHHTIRFLKQVKSNASTKISKYLRCKFYYREYFRTFITTWFIKTMAFKLSYKWLIIPFRRTSSNWTEIPKSPSCRPAPLTL